MHRDLSAFDINAITTELNTLNGSYIDQIYQRQPDELFIRLNIKKQKTKAMLYIQNEKLIALTTTKYTMPQTPTTFAMTLRKHLQNAIITHTTQHHFDRILTITITKHTTTYHLIIELFSNGNILLLNEDHTIILPLKTQKWAHRTLRSKRPYQPPPTPTNPLTLTYEDFTTLLKTGKKDLVRTLATTLNMGGTYAEELCTQAKIDKNTPIQDLTGTTNKKLYKTLTTFITPFKTQQFHPTQVHKNTETIDIIPFPFTTYKQPSYEQKPIESLLYGLASFIKTTPSPRQQEIETKYDQQQEKLQRQQKQQQQTIQEFKQKIIKNQEIGDLIYLHFQPITKLLEYIQQNIQNKNKQTLINTINQNKTVTNFDPTNQHLTITLEDQQQKPYTFTLNIRQSTAENANAYYSKSKKLQEKLKGAQIALNNTTQKIKKHESTPPTKKQEKKPTKHYWFEQFHWTLSSNNNLIIAGKDAKSNEYLVKKYLKDGDRYVHADIHGAPSCIIKQHDPKNKPISIEPPTLEEACIFASCYSKAWNQYAETQAYWVLPEQVSKTPESGEFIPKGAFIIRGKRNYVQCPLQLAIGEITIEDHQKIVAGPLSAIQKHTKKYIMIQPGTISKNNCAKKIAKIMNTTVENIHPLLPSGSSDIINKIGYDDTEEQ